MNTESAVPSPASLLREAEARMAQALDQFFQRSRTPIQNALVRALSGETSASALTKGQLCLDWLSVHPDALSTAFADQFRLHLARPETFDQRHRDRPTELQLVDEDTLRRQLAEEKSAARLGDDLRADLLLLSGRLRALRHAVGEDPGHGDTFGPLPVVRALSRGLDSAGVEPGCGTLLVESAALPLRDTLKHTYAALNQFLGRHVLPDPAAITPPPRRAAEGDAGAQVLARLQAAAPRIDGTGNAAMPGHGPGQAQHALVESLGHWQTRPAAAGASAGAGPTVLALRQLQQDARQSAAAFDLAVLDAVATLFEFMLDDPDIAPRYRTEIAHLQIPVLRTALLSPEFFSDPQHPARQLLDTVGLYSRRFPERAPAHGTALAQVQAACTTVLQDPEQQADAFARAQRNLTTWLADEDARTAAELVQDVSRLEDIERQELGTLLALENLRDLTERYSAPESVLRRLEGAWVPYMAALYVAEAGEGPEWRAACLTLSQLFLSLQAPEDGAARESRLQSIPQINAALRRGLLAQNAEPGQLKDFFSAITTVQETWVRPGVGQAEAPVRTFATQHVSPEQVEALRRRTETAGDAPEDPALLQAQQLLEGDWVDFDPPYEGLATARVAWVGVRGYLLFCDSAGEQRFSLDCEQLADAIHAGRARISEQSLTRKAMLRLNTQLSAGVG